MLQENGNADASISQHGTTERSKEKQLLSRDVKSSRDSLGSPPAMNTLQSSQDLFTDGYEPGRLSLRRTVELSGTKRRLQMTQANDSAVKPFQVSSEMRREEDKLSSAEENKRENQEKNEADGGSNK